MVPKPYQEVHRRDCNVEESCGMEARDEVHERCDRMVEKNNLLAAESFSCLQLKDTFQVDGEILEALETMH